MRRPIIGGNWKMNKGIPFEAAEMLKKLIPLVKNIDNVDIVITPPYTVLFPMIELTKNTNIMIGAQNMYFEEKGAFTGEISPVFLKELGCSYVILGHSERRDILKETDEIVNKKLKKALNFNLKPIVCIGEHLKERETHKTKEYIEKQFRLSFKDLSGEEIRKTVIAYEPIWAIGTGRTATPEQAEEIHIFIRDLITNVYDSKTANAVRIQYGGSIKPSNAKDIFKKENIDGGLVGGASLQAESFSEIIEAANNSPF
ncbi:MAG TPA: triose-phosphate isomerase [Candidatus Nanopelagicaceae bacterium]|jgi:triosephosphate isomerase|nr:triose-phosphate isomerase [Candidatus Nanopelagicaceae bacterium]